MAPTGVLRGINPLVYEQFANIHFCLLSSLGEGQPGGSSVVESADGSIGDGGVGADFVGWLNSYILVRHLGDPPFSCAGHCCSVHSVTT